MGGVTTFWAPVHRPLARQASSESGIPLNAAPSIDFLGSAIQDHRYAYNKRGSSSTLPGILGWFGANSPIVANIVPSTIATANIAALANVTSGTAMTKVSSSGAGITVASTSAPANFWSSGVSVTSGCVIDGLPTYQLFGGSGSFTTGFFSPDTVVGRAVSITAAASATGGHFIVSGYDCYGYAMSEDINAAAGAATTNGKKAFKVVTSVVPQFTDAHNYSVGTADIFGFGIRADLFSDVRIYWNSAGITATTGFVAAVTTDPATTTTGDVRGTYAVQSASDGTKRLVIYATPVLSALATNPTKGLFGVTQA
jgi:hypothetical protein